MKYAFKVTVTSGPRMPLHIYVSPDYKGKSTAESVKRVMDMVAGHMHAVLTSALKALFSRHPGPAKDYNHKYLVDYEAPQEAAFLSQRDSVLLSLNKEKIVAFCTEYNIAMPAEEEAFWEKVHLARLGIPHAPLQAIVESVKFLAEHGTIHEFTIGGERCQATNGGSA
jgi:hypothetical protein